MEVFRRDNIDASKQIYYWLKICSWRLRLRCRWSVRSDVVKCIESVYAVFCFVCLSGSKNCRRLCAFVFFYIQNLWLWWRQIPLTLTWKADRMYDLLADYTQTVWQRIAIFFHQIMVESIFHPICSSGPWPSISWSIIEVSNIWKFICACLANNGSHGTSTIW